MRLISTQRSIFTCASFNDQSIAREYVFSDDPALFSLPRSFLKKPFITTNCIRGAFLRFLSCSSAEMPAFTKLATAALAERGLLSGLDNTLKDVTSGLNDGIAPRSHKNLFSFAD